MGAQGLDLHVPIEGKETVYTRSGTSRRAHDARVARRRYDRNAPFYDLLEAGMERSRYRQWRKLLWEKVEGERVIEVGVGTGHNLPYHPEGTTITAVDLSGRMLARAVRRRGESWADHLAFAQMDVHELAFDSASFDTVVATFVFCSVPDPVRGLQEVGRVLAAGGRLLLLEHVRSPNPLLGVFMDLVNPVMVRVTGANINRDTVANVRRAGLLVDRVTVLGFGGIYVLIEARRHPVLVE